MASTSTTESVKEPGTAGSPTLAASSVPRRESKASPLGWTPTPTLTIFVLGLGPEEADGVLAAVRREGQVAGPVHEDPGDTWQSAD